MRDTNKGNDWNEWRRNKNRENARWKGIKMSTEELYVVRSIVPFQICSCVQCLVESFSTFIFFFASPSFHLLLIVHLLKVQTYNVKVSMSSERKIKNKGKEKLWEKVILEAEKEKKEILFCLWQQRCTLFTCVLRTNSIKLNIWECLLCDRCGPFESLKSQNSNASPTKFKIEIHILVFL